MARTRPSSSPARMFVSSTCHDLIDLRAEVRAALESDGFLVSMSDEYDTFEVDGKSDSIETCLANLRQSDGVIVILSKRYGPPLRPLGTTKSATHVEYDEAVKLEKPVYFCVRDRLMAIYEQWRASGMKKVPDSAWCDAKDVEPLLRWIDEHQRLEATKKVTNWVNMFSNSTELKRILVANLGSYSGKLVLERLQREGRLPSLTLAFARAQGAAPTTWVENKGSDVLYGTDIKFESGQCVRLGDLSPGFKNRIEGGARHDTRVDVEWTSMRCGRMRDRYHVDAEGHATLTIRRLLTSSTVIVLGPDDPDPVF